VDTPPAGPHSPAEALRQLLRFISATSQENPRLRAIIADAHFNRACPPTAVTRVRQWVAGLASAAERLITEGQRSGHFRELDARGVAGAAISTALWSEPGAEDMVLDFCTWH
jgi:hypothetical protein